MLRVRAGRRLERSARDRRRALVTITALSVVLAVVGGVWIVERVSPSGTGGGPTSQTAALATAPGTAQASTTSVASMTTTIPNLATPLAPAPPPTPLPATRGALADVYTRIPTTNRVIFLGIDDGLVRDPDVLALIRTMHIPVTAFLVKPEALDGATYWRELQAAGGVIEAHTITHPDLRKLSASQQRHEICGTLDTYQLLFGRRPSLFRPPYGYYNDSVRAIAASCGFKGVVAWEGSTNDGRLDMQAGTRLHPGDVLLLHWRNDLYENLDVVLAACRAQGFSIASLESYLVA